MGIRNSNSLFLSSIRGLSLETRLLWVTTVTMKVHPRPQHSYRCASGVLGYLCVSEDFGLLYFLL